MEGFLYHWHRYNECLATTDTNIIQLDAVFANRSEDDDIYPLMTAEIADAKKADATLKHHFNCNALAKDWKSSSLRAPCVSAKKVGWLSLSHSSNVQSCGITTRFSALGTLISKR